MVLIWVVHKKFRKFTQALNGWSESGIGYCAVPDLLPPSDSSRGIHDVHVESRQKAVLWSSRDQEPQTMGWLIGWCLTFPFVTCMDISAPVCSEQFVRRGARSCKRLTGHHTSCWQCTDDQAVEIKIKQAFIAVIHAELSLFTDKNLKLVCI